MKKDYSKLIKEIAEAMEDTTHETFIHLPTLALLKLPTDDLLDEMDEKEIKSKFGKAMAEYEKNELDYLDVPFPDSDENYKLMKSFVNAITDQQIKSRLQVILSEAKPFKHFKTAIESKADLNEQWLQFKAAYYLQKAENFLKSEVL